VGRDITQIKNFFYSSVREGALFPLRKKGFLFFICFFFLHGLCYAREGVRPKRKNIERAGAAGFCASHGSSNALCWPSCSA
jgi:hypothetical protein